MDIGIVGLGLIGGCLGLDYRALGHRVYGVARREETCTAAIAAGVVDQASPDQAILAGMDLVVICTPIAAIVPTLTALVPHLAPHTVVTDVGSVKGEIVAAATALWPRFVGGHPMAGKAEVGLAAAELGLFRQRAYVITPLPETPPDGVDILDGLATSLGAIVLHCAPQAHDRAVAWISHLPVMVSTSLIQACLQESDPMVQQLAQQLASSGFCDTSRVGGGNPELGMMMARYNQGELLRSLRVYQNQLRAIADLIEQGHWDSLETLLQHSHDARSKFL